MKHAREAGHPKGKANNGEMRSFKECLVVSRRSEIRPVDVVCITGQPARNEPGVEVLHDITVETPMSWAEMAELGISAFNSSKKDGD